MTESPAGKWTSTMEPFPVDEERIRPTALEDRLRESSVSLRGWDFPHLGNDYHPAQDALEGRIDWDQYREGWKLRTSGLFTYQGEIREDHTVRYKNTLSLVSTLWFLTEIWEFARRLYGLDASVDSLRVMVSVDGLMNRELLVDRPDLGWTLGKSVAKIKDFTKTKELTRHDLMNRSREIAVGWGESLFHAMGSKVGPDELGQIQERLYGLHAGSE